MAGLIFDSTLNPCSPLPSNSIGLTRDLYESAPMGADRIQSHSAFLRRTCTARVPPRPPPLISGSVFWTIEIEGLITKRGPLKTTCRASDRGRGPPRTIHPFPCEFGLCGSRAVKPRKPKSGVTCSFSLILYPANASPTTSAHTCTRLCVCAGTFRRH